MGNTELEQFKKYIVDLLRFMTKEGYSKKPYPKVIINIERGENGVFDNTAYYNPETREITVFTNNRGLKDCLRSVAHENIHHKQNLEGRLGKDAYSGDKITEDERLVALEKEAYLDGNISFRKFTEFLRKKEGSEPTHD
jgi:hypothetical protein